MHTSFGLKEQIKLAMENLKEQIKTLIDIEQRSASMSPITPIYISHMLNLPLTDVEAAMKDMGI